MESCQRSVRRLPAVSICMAAGALTLMSLAPSAGSGQEQYPTRPVRVIVGFAAGGPSDIIARVVGNKLGEILGQQFVIENRAGASGNIATQAVARSANDGYTLLLATFTNAVNETLFTNLSFKFMRDFVPVASFAETANVLVVHPSLEVNSVSDLIKLAKSKPGEILYATAGKGTATHFAGELFKMMADVNMIPVHYKGGGETLKDLLSGEIKVMFSTIPPVVGLINDGKLRGIATTGQKPAASLPNLPTVSGSGLAGYDMRLWFGLAAPAGTPRAIVERLHAATRQALAGSEVKAALAKQGYEPLTGTPDDFKDYIGKEIEKWGKVVKVVGTIGN